MENLNVVTPEQVAELAAKGTQGEWEEFNMTHVEGRPMTSEELEEYVTNSVKMSGEVRFLFISGRAGDGREVDVCHVGNGPNGPYNAQRIANVPAMERLIAEQAARITELEGALERVVTAKGLTDPVDEGYYVIQQARAALAKKEGE